MTTHYLRRRLLLATGALIATPSVIAQSKLRRMAWFGVGKAEIPSPFLEAMRVGLRERGWQEGRNLTLSTFFSDGTLESAGRQAREIAAGEWDVIVAFGREVLALHRANPKSSVVFALSGDPIDAGIVKSLAHPGGNFTGISFLSFDLVGKRIELLRECLPQMRRLGVLARPEHPGEARERAVSETIARKLGLTVTYAPVQAVGGLNEALQPIVRERCDALVTFPDGIMLANSGRIAKFALEARIASISGWGGFADNGFLLTYGPNLEASYRGLARHVDRVLRGTKPSDLPVELPTIIELVLNARTAKALGIAIPPTIMVQATRVIQ